VGFPGIRTTERHRCLYSLTETPGARWDPHTPFTTAITGPFFAEIRMEVKNMLDFT
jgi:hypothetical protein